MLKKYYTQSDEQDDLISIGTIGLIKGVSSYRPEKGTRLATYAAKCVENEILMYFRSRKKAQGEVSLNDSLDSDSDGESLYLMDVVGVEDTMYLDMPSGKAEAPRRQRHRRLLPLQAGEPGRLFPVRPV